MNVITWNMQGSNASTENKWNRGVKPLLQASNPTPIVCLQECGGVPNSVVLLDTIHFPLTPTVTDVVRIYLWGMTDTRLGYYIFFHNWDTGGNRVNTAIVTDAPPENLGAGVVLIPPHGGAVWRPALGVNFNNTWVFSFHAISPGGPDGAGLLAAVAANFPSWVVAADWNRAPNTLNAPGGSSICPPNANTYSVANPRVPYDYCVCSGPQSVTGTVLNQVVMSDHFPVGFGF